jgi:hypothetical protein
MPNASLKKAGAWKPAGRAKCWPVPASERQRDRAKVSVRPAAVLDANRYQFKEDPSPPRRLARPARRPVPAGRHRALHLRTVWGCGPDAGLRKRADRLRAALWLAGWGGALPGGGLFPRGSGSSRLRGCAISARTARQSCHRPPTTLRWANTAQKLGKNGLLAPPRQVWQDGAAMNESEKQFSLTRAALSTCGRAKKQIPERQGEVLLLRGWKSLKFGAKSPKV